VLQVFLHQKAACVTKLRVVEYRSKRMRDSTNYAYLGDVYFATIIITGNSAYTPNV